MQTTVNQLPKERKVYFYILVLFFIILLFDVSLWGLDQIAGEERGVIFSYKLSSLISYTNISALALVLLILLILKGVNFLKNASLTIITLVITILFVEGVFYLLLQYKNRNNNDSYKEVSDVPFFENDPLLGYKAQKNIKTKYKKLIINNDSNDTTTIFNAVYTSDSSGLRTCDDNQRERKDKYALFFGCSYTFGVGVEDTQTVSYYYSKYDTSVATYNFGLGGYGPQHMLARLENHDLKKIVKQKEGVGFYIYLTGHESRAIGDMTTYLNWGKDFPYYNYVNNDLVHLGSFSADRPVISSLYSVLGASNIIKYFNINFPPSLKENHYKLTADIIKESYKQYKRQFNNDDFYVVIYPSYYTEIIPFLKANNIKVLDLSKLFDPTEREFYISEYDRHPTPHAYKKLTQAILQKLNQSK